MSEPRIVPMLIGAGGLANAVGGVLVAVAYLLHAPHPTPEALATDKWLAVHVVLMVAILAGIAALVALLAAHLRDGGGFAGMAGFVLALLSLLFLFGMDYAEVFIFPTLAVEYPAVVVEYGDGTEMPLVGPVFQAAGLCFLAGYLLLANELRRTATVSTGSALLLMVGTVVFGAGLSGLVSRLVIQVGAVVFGAGLVWTGLSLYAGGVRRR